MTLYVLEPCASYQKMMKHDETMNQNPLFAMKAIKLNYEQSLGNHDWALFIIAQMLGIIHCELTVDDEG